MTKLLIQLGAILATVGPVAAEQEVAWPAVDALRIPVIVQPLPPTPRTIADEPPVETEVEVRLAKNMELPSGEVVILPPTTVSLTSPEVPRR
ncbi:MAG: hypothetical protein WD081_09225 [Gammaproteobacteria bacterium]